MVVPMTTGSRPAPYRIPIRFDQKDGLVLLEQTRAVDQDRLIRRLGAAPATALGATLAGLRALFADAAYEGGKPLN